MLTTAEVSYIIFQSRNRPWRVIFLLSWILNISSQTKSQFWKQTYVDYQKSNVNKLKFFSLLSPLVVITKICPFGYKLPLWAAIFPNSLKQKIKLHKKLTKADKGKCSFHVKKKKF